MRTRASVFVAAVGIAIFAHTGLGQSRDPIAGVWELVSSKNLSTGAAESITAPPLRVIFLDGYFVQFAAEKDRQKMTTPRSEWTREQFADRLRLQGQSGTYRITGKNTFTRKIEVAADPNNEGRESVVEFRVENDTLVLVRSTAEKEKIEARYRRLKPTT
jgi:hypothetical protein